MIHTNNKKFFLYIALIFSSQFAVASDNVDHETIPWLFIFSQTVNVIIVIFLLLYFLKKPIKDFFKKRSSDYFKQKKLAQTAYLEAQQKYDAIRLRLKQLKDTADQSLLKAKNQSENNKQEVINQAKLRSQKIKVDTDNFIVVEKNRAVADITQELFENSLKMATKKISTEADKSVHTRLNNKFINNIQTAQQ